MKCTRNLRPASLLALIIVIAACDVQISPQRLSVDAERALQLLALKHGGPDCAHLTASMADPAATLLEISEKVKQPPGAGIRAAVCLIENHAASVEPQLLSWVSRRQTRGFGLLVLNSLDRIDEPLALRISKAALAGEFADDARVRVARSTRPAVRQLTLQR